MASFRILDCHLHIGVQHVRWGWENIRPLLLAAGITRAAPIAPVEDVYDRRNPRFTDTAAWQDCRRRAHRYLLQINDPQIETFPYFFVWNDFAWEDLGPEFVAIKWHRHPDEPEYNYRSPRCREFLDAVRSRNLPILLEESLFNTLFFLERLAPDLRIIIPHLGYLNGGYHALKEAGVWSQPRIYADTAVARLEDLQDYLACFGSDRLMFGSDFPFSTPPVEVAKILSLDLPAVQTQAILADNFQRLCGMS